MLHGLVFTRSARFEESPPDVDTSVACGHGNVVIVIEMFSVVDQLPAAKFSDLLVYGVVHSAQL